MDIESEIIALQSRNRRVEADKAWEVSWTRRLLIAAMTYVVAAIWLVLINDVRPLLKALVPAAGYVLSTISIRVVKSWWISRLA